MFWQRFFQNCKILEKLAALLRKNYVNMQRREGIEASAANTKKKPFEERRRHMEPYLHKVQYYETDKMGIAHHSNYIRWMEEARVDFLEKIGGGFDRLEAEGIVSPVVGVHGRYKKSCTFADVLEITVKVQKYNGMMMHLAYEMKLAGSEQVLFTGVSEHCFLDQTGKPLRLKQKWQELDEILKNCAAEYEAEKA